MQSASEPKKVKTKRRVRKRKRSMKGRGLVNECCVAIVCFAALTFIVVEAIILALKPEQFPDHLILPNRSVFTEIVSPNPDVPKLYELQRTTRLMKTNKIDEYLVTIKDKLRSMRKRYQSLESPRFKWDENTTGIVTTCNLNAVCLSNLHHLFETINVTVPVGLLLFFFSSSVSHCFVHALLHVCIWSRIVDVAQPNE